MYVHIYVYTYTFTIHSMLRMLDAAPLPKAPFSIYRSNALLLQVSCHTKAFKLEQHFFIFSLRTCSITLSCLSSLVANSRAFGQMLTMITRREYRRSYFVTINLISNHSTLSREFNGSSDEKTIGERETCARQWASNAK